MFSLEEKVGQMMMVGFHGTTAPQYLLDWLASGRIGGIYLFARNIESPQQVKNLVQQCHEAAKYPILVGIDQEGGIVARLTQGFTESPGAMALAASSDDEQAFEVSAMLARELRAMGINWNFAPVADITHDISNPSVGTRSVGRDKELVSQFVIQQIQGFQSEKVAATVKHFPGIGNTSIDTHEALAKVDASLAFLWEQDLIPFQAAIQSGVASVMVSHVMFNELDSQHPSTLSPVVVNKLLRQDIGFDGAVCTDCMEMKAISNNYGAAESAILTVLAGVDMVMFSHTKDWQEQAYQAVLDAVHSGRISEERIDQSVERIQHLKAQYQLKDVPPLEIIHSTEHLELAKKSARAGTILIKADNTIFPLQADKGQKIACIEFASYRDTGAMNAGEHTGFATYLLERVPGIKTIALKSVDIDEASLQTAYQLAETSDIIILASRNAHLLPQQFSVAQEVIAKAKKLILICLRNPYDIQVLDAQTIICTNGDSAPSLQAAVSAILGDFTPTGKLTV